MGGEVSPFRLVRLSAEELLSKELSEWKKPDATEVNVIPPPPLPTKHRSACGQESIKCILLSPAGAVSQCKSPFRAVQTGQQA